MGHYAFIDDNNIVTQVIVGRDEHDLVEDVADWETYYGERMGQVCKRTSYNTYGGGHNGEGVPFRYNYAGIGFRYDEERDAFIPPQPFASWVLDEATCLWVAPVAYPDNGGDYFWDEEAGNWVEVLGE